MVRLHEHAEDVIAGAARRRSDPTFESVTDHPRSATDVSFGDRAGRRVCQRALSVLCRDVLTLRVVQESVVRLADDGQRPPVVVCAFRRDRVTDDADAERVRDSDRRRQQAGLAHPLEAGQLAVPVQAVAAREQRHLGRDQHRHARPDRIVFDQRAVTDQDSVDVRDGVAGPRAPFTDRNPELACPHRYTLMRLPSCFPDPGQGSEAGSKPAPR